MNTEELDRFYSEDFYNIIVAIQPMSRSIYIFMVVIFNLMLGLMYLISLVVSEFIL